MLFTVRLLLAIAAASLPSNAKADPCAADTTCADPSPHGLLMLKSACTGPNITTQQFSAGECIDSTSFLPADQQAHGIDRFKTTFLNGADFYIPEITLYPAVGCNASASTKSPWTLRFNGRDKYDRQTTVCHSFAVGGVAPGSVKFSVRALGRRRED